MIQRSKLWRTRRFFICAVFGLLVLGNLPHLDLTPSCRAATVSASQQGSSSVPAPTPGPLDAFGWNGVADNVRDQITSEKRELLALEKTLKQSDASVGDGSLDKLAKRADKAVSVITALEGQLQSYQTVYKSYLGVIGEKAEEGESADIASQRGLVRRDLAKIRSSLVQTRLLKLHAKQLQLEIQRQNVAIQSAFLSEKVDSPLLPSFWTSIYTELPQVREVLSSRTSNGHPGALAAWLWYLIAIAATLIALPFISRVSYRLLRRFEQRFLNAFFGSTPEGGLGAAIVVLANGIVVALASIVIWEILFNLLVAGRGAHGSLLQGLLGALPISGFVVGIGAPILGRSTPYKMIPDDVRSRFYGTEIVAAVIVVVQNVLLIFTRDNLFPTMTQRLMEGTFAIAVALMLMTLSRRINAKSIDDRLFVAPAIRGAYALVGAAACIAVGLGYIAFAFALTSWVIALTVGCAILLILLTTFKELIAQIFLGESRLSNRLRIYGVSRKRVEQFGVILSGLVSLAFVLLLIAVGLSGGYFDLPTIAENLRSLFVGQSINGFHLSLNTVFVAIFTLAVAYFAIRKINQWLEQQLFPTTRLDNGARSTIINVFTYLAWIGIFLFVLSQAGLTVSNLTWVVSALSVGIGFGLQSIVQNFVSGVILLAERPIRVGDLIEIGSIKGDVSRISVRSTEIRLGDGSLMIVPNSQFITAAVRNASRDTVPSAVSASVTISSRADASKAQSVLLDMMKERADILQTPGPGVAVAAIGDSGILLTLSAKVASVRSVGDVTNSIMLDAYRTLHTSGIALGQTLSLINDTPEES